MTSTGPGLMLLTILAWVAYHAGWGLWSMYQRRLRGKAFLFDFVLTPVPQETTVLWYGKKTTPTEDQGPPQNAKELLARYQQGERDFSYGRLGGANLEGADLERVNFEGANLRRASLRGANLAGANLKGADLESADLEGANLRRTFLRSSNLRAAFLQGANLTKVMGEPANRQGCFISLETYTNSGWDTPTLFAWWWNGASIVDLDHFPEEIQKALQDRKGLTLYFNTYTTPMDRFLVNGVIFGLLGRDTDCRVVEFRELENNALIRIEASSMDDLERVAETLYTRVWERKQEQTALQVARLLNLDQIHSSLSLMRNKLEKMELRSANEASPREWRTLMLDQFLKLHPVQLDELTFRLSVPSSLLPGPEAPFVQRVIAVIEYLEQQEGGLKRLEGELRDVKAIKG